MLSDAESMVQLQSDRAQSAAVPRNKGAPAGRLEIPTLLLSAAIYVTWLMLTNWHRSIPWPLLALGGGIVIAWQGSLQHETIHGHPTGLKWVDWMIGAPPLAIWLPYGIYHRSHLAHHRTPDITDPFADPESHYVAQGRGWGPRVARLEATLIGRLLLGPPIRIGRFLVTEIVRFTRQPLSAGKDWIPHIILLVPLLWWLDRVGLSLSTYALAFIFPGTALTLLRSFAEHRASESADQRAAIVPQSGLLGLLFLYNNLHAAHHARPDLPWYRLPAHYRRHAARYAAAPHYRSYGEIIRRFAWRAQDDVIHPDYRDARRS